MARAGLFRMNSTASAPFSAELAFLVSEGRQTGKPIMTRKTFLMDYYKYLNDKNQIVIYAHHNNLSKTEATKLRSDLHKAGAHFHVVSNAIYNVYLRSAHEEDPAAEGNTKKNLDVKHPLAPLLVGPTGVITVEMCDPSVVALVLTAIKPLQDKFFLVGARIESSVYNSKDVKLFKDLPNKEQLQAQLAGLLTVLGGAGLVRTLETASNVLYLTLDQRRKDIDPSELDPLEQEQAEKEV